MVKVFNQQFKKGQGDVQEVDADIVLGSEDFLVLVDATAGPVTVTLLRADGWGGKRFCIMKLDNSVNAVTIVPVAGQTINGEATKTIAGQFEVLDLISDGEEFKIVAQAKGDPQFITMGLAGDQGNINPNTEVAFVATSSNGLSVIAGRVTLKAGITYVVNSHIRHVGSVGNTAANYVWRDFTNAVNISKEAIIASNDNLSKDGTQPSISFVIKPITDIVIGLRCTSVSVANQGLAADATQALINSV